MALKAWGNLEGYFYERLRLAQRRASHQTDEAIEHYLVQMLVRFGRADDEGMAVRPLCYEVAELEGIPDAGERLRRFRRVGDTALFTCGLFPESLPRRGVSPSYMAWMGRRAYGEAAALACRSEAPFGKVYPRLDRDFLVLVRVLSEVLEELPPRCADDVVRVYRRWRETGSNKLARSLRRAGIQPHDAEQEN